MYSVSTEHSSFPRKRAVRDDVRKSRTALKLVMPINRQIGLWQSSLARLITAAERTGPLDGDSAGFRQQVDALEEQVRMHRQRFASSVAELPADVRDNSRIADTWRALDSVHSGLKRARDVLR